MAEDESSLIALSCFRVFFFVSLAHLSAASCEQDAVGLADGYILDSQLTVSSELNANTPAKNGRLNYTAGSSWCASTSDSNPYLQIDLQTLHIICAVSSQGNSQAGQWVQTYTLQSSTDGTTWTDYKEDGQVKVMIALILPPFQWVQTYTLQSSIDWTPWTDYKEDGQVNKKIFSGNYNQNSTVKHILYAGIVARYVRFVVGTKHGEACLRVEVFGVPRTKVQGNIALFKPTSQSSTRGSSKSSNAVDGGKGTHYTKCTHTADSTKTNPWWRVDLGRVEPVAEVYILNRGDCCEGRLNGAEIRVGDSTANGGATNHLCADKIQVAKGKGKFFTCKPKAYGRYVSVRIPGNDKTLTLCEVEVYSTHISNLALNQPAQQVSIDHGGAASRAVDGKTSTDWDQNSCTHTDWADNAWWRVDLGSSLPVAEVVIVNRACDGACADILKAFEIRIGNSTQTGGETNPSCGGIHSLSSGETKSFYCLPPLVGQFVYVRVPGIRKILTVCEVEVYAIRRTSNNVKACTGEAVGLSSSSTIRDYRFSASSTLSSSRPSNGRLNGASAWIPSSNSNSNDYLQIDLGSVYFVCGVATQGNPSADDWTKTYKIETSIDNINWEFYTEDNAVKNFTGNSDRISIVRSELYDPLAAKFVRFYPLSFNNNKALRVEVYGSMQDCLSPVGNERDVNRNFGITASSILDNDHRASYSRLYGYASWCSSSASAPQYLEVNFRKVVTVMGVATQGDATSSSNKWVTSYAISYGYDKQTWINYAAGQQLTGNSDKNTVVVNWLSSPFAAQYVRILPKTYHSGLCMRMDLFACKDFQIPFLFVEGLKDEPLTPSPSVSITLNCTAMFSQQRPPVYEWSKDGKVLSESSSSLTITYSSAIGIYNNYYCSRQSASSRDVQCSSTYQCSASLPGLQVKNETKANVIVVLRVPGQPVVTINPSDIKARSAQVTWSYFPRSDEAPINAFDIRYQNSTFTGDIPLSGSASSKELINLKPYALYSVSVMATSVLGKGVWSNLVNFTTKTAVPEVFPRVINVTALTSKTIYVEWQKPSLDKVNGPLSAYDINYKEKGLLATVKVIRVKTPSTSGNLINLKIWTDYVIKIRVTNGDYTGPWSPELPAKTAQDAPTAPQNMQLNIQAPSLNVRPRMTVTWNKPASENGVIQKYTLVYTYTTERQAMSSQHNTDDGQTFSYSFDVLGGIQYSVTLRAETIKPGSKETKVEQVPVYKPSVAPRNITSQKINETTYRISWDPLPRDVSNGEVIAYEVKKTRVSASRTARAVSSANVALQNTSDTFTVLFGLTSCSQYSVEVRAYTTAGPGVFGRLPVRIVTSAPSPPSDVKTDQTPDKRSVTLLWSKPKQHGDNVQEYTVIYEGRKDYYPDFKNDGRAGTKSLSLKVSNLYPGTTYNFVVIATTHCGDGLNSTIASTETLVDAPLAPISHETEDISTTETSVNVTVWPALQDNGPISHYQVLVHRVKEWTEEISDWSNFGPDFFISAQIPAASVNPSMVFVVGDGKTYDSYINKKLLSGQKYNIYSRALTTMPSKKRSVRQFLFGKAILLAKVNVEEVVIASESPTPAGQKGSPTAAIAASVVVVLVLAIVALGVGGIVWRRRRSASDEPDSKMNEMNAINVVNGAYEMGMNDDDATQQNASAVEQPVEEIGEPIYGNTGPDEVDDHPKPVPVSRFSEYVTYLKREKSAGFAKQYKQLSPGQQFSWDNAKVPENKIKNRYGNIIAYDHSRVVLPLIDGIEHSDYINASYLHGYDGTQKTYIACQGPVPGTFHDFWRMIWQENATTIVMLTRLVEHGRTKCHQYWPDKSETYHDITVTNHKTEKFADYAVRTFVLCQNGSGESRQVQQFHFLVWPDKGVPRHATAVLGLRRKVRATLKDSKYPLVVHCSAGVGRSGAFVIIDAMLQSAKNKKIVDVFNYVQVLRNNRISMVQTEEQYVFIYMALLEAITCGNTEIPAHDIRIAVKKLAAVNPKTKMSGLASEYQRLELITADDVADREDDVGRKTENSSKNRFPDIVPLNGSRVVLKRDKNNDYINASFVDTFRERNSFIMTQAPLSNTIEDFWRMVWDYNIGTIVMLNEYKEKGQVYPMYWASEGSATFGEFVIETASHEIFQDFSEREFTVAKKTDPKDVRRVHHFQVTGWADKGVPANAHCILDLINVVERSQRNSNNAPVIVQCSNGIGRSGTFCAILSIIERLKSEQVIDVCQSIKVIRVNRPRAVDCKAQYVFCYNIVQKYLDSFSDYANFN